MLTVDYDTLGLRAGDRLLDIGAGFGRHAYEGLRRGADVVACDMGMAELVECNEYFAAMVETGEAPSGVAGASAGYATSLPFPDHTFDRVIAAEILEHIIDHEAAVAELARVLRPGGSMAVTVPAWFGERVCWALTEEYHAPFVEGGHVRIYRRRDLTKLLRRAGLTPGPTGRAHSLHTPYWWLKCAVGVTDDEHPLVRAYHRMLVWDITDGPTLTRVADRLLNPMLAKSIVIYATKPTAPSSTTPSRKEQVLVPR